MTKNIKLSGIIILNIFLTSIVVGFQFLLYGFAPSIDPKVIYKDNFDKKAECIRAAIGFNTKLILEIVICAIIIWIINYLYLKNISKKPAKLATIITSIYLLITITTLVMFTINYIDRNMGM